VRRGLWITVLAVAAFAAIVIARLPATWIIPAPPSPVTCADVDGSIWNGTCSGLTVQGTPLGDMTWSVHALRLLTGKLSANIVLTHPARSLSGDFDVGLDKSITARNVQANIPFDETIKNLLPPLRTLSGSANANIVYAHITKQILKEIQGRIEVHGLEDHDRNGVTPLGSYSVTFPGGGSGDPTGQLRDLGGPLAIEGTLRVMQDQPGVELQGYVTPRADAPADLRHQLEYLGSPDAQGRRMFGPIPYTF
jgi:general secretion pathway protein N